MFRRGKEEMVEFFSDSVVARIISCSTLGGVCGAMIQYQSAT